MATAISNWRLLEADIVDCLQQHGVKITRDNFGNPHCATINIHELALELSERGVMVMATPVAVMARGKTNFFKDNFGSPPYSHRKLVLAQIYPPSLINIPQVISTL